MSTNDFIISLLVTIFLIVFVTKVAGLCITYHFEKVRAKIEQDGNKERNRILEEYTVQMRIFVENSIKEGR